MVIVEAIPSAAQICNSLECTLAPVLVGMPRWIPDFPGTRLALHPKMILIAATLPNSFPSLQDPHPSKPL